MKVNAINAVGLFIAALGAATPAGAAEPVSGTLSANPTGEVSISVIRGSVTIVSVEGEEVSVEGTRDHESEAFIFEREGDVVLIEDKLPRHTSSGPGTRITVSVPRGSRVRAQLVSADIDAKGLQGAVRLSTVSGAIVAASLGAQSEITSVSGRISLTGAGGEVRLESISGRIEASTSAERVYARSTSGRVRIENDHPLDRGRVSSVSGSLELSTPVQPDVEIDVETVSGSATLTLRGDLDLRLSAIGGPGGTVRNRLSDAPVIDSGPGLGDRLEARFGQGSGYVRASTVSGTITVEGG